MKASKRVLAVLVLFLGIVAIMGSCTSKKATCPAYSKVNVQQTQNNG